MFRMLLSDEGITSQESIITKKKKEGRADLQLKYSKEEKKKKHTLFREHVDTSFISWLSLQHLELLLNTEEWYMFLHIGYAPFFQ